MSIGILLAWEVMERDGEWEVGGSQNKEGYLTYVHMLFTLTETVMNRTINLNLWNLRLHAPLKPISPQP